MVSGRSGRGVHRGPLNALPARTSGRGLRSGASGFSRGRFQRGRVESRPSCFGSVAGIEGRKAKADPAALTRGGRPSPSTRLVVARAIHGRRLVRVIVTKIRGPDDETSAITTWIVAGPGFAAFSCARTGSCVNLTDLGPARTVHYPLPDDREDDRKVSRAGPTRRRRHGNCVQGPR